MNCLDFRRRTLADPRNPGEEDRAHALACPACREFLERQRELDAELFAALQVPPPDGLADRILVARGLSRRRWAWPVAASVVLAAGLAVLWPRATADPLGREAIAHVAHETQAFTSYHSVAADLLPTLLAQQGMDLVRTIGQVTYSRLCPLDGRVARHLVVRTDEGPVTLFLLPEDPKARGRAVVERDGMAAITLPAARGSITIVANRLQQALDVEKTLRAS